MERRNAKGPAVNLSTLLSPSAPGICWSRRTTRTYIPETLCRPSPPLSLSLSPYPPSSYRHHPQFAFLKGAQKPPEIAASSSDVTAGSISVPLSTDLVSPSSPLSVYPFSALFTYASLFLFFYLSFSSSTIDDFTGRYLPRRQEFR